MVLIIHVIFLLSATVILADRRGKRLVETIPVVFSFFILSLYFLAFFNRMWCIDYVSLIGIIFSLHYYRSYKGKLLQRLIDQLLEPSFLIFAVVSIIGMIALSARGISTFDDFNFWIADIKSLYCLQGFAAKGFNCAPGYGDYPPAMQLVAAWLMHSLGGYCEGYAFSAYFLLMQIYMAPLLVKVPHHPIVCLGAVVWMFVVFSCGPDILFGLSADVLMGIVYGCSLLFIFFRHDPSDHFEIFDIAAILSVLVLTKSIGIQWALFAVAFMFVQTVLEKRQTRIRHFLWMLLPICIWLSWDYFCKLFQRTTYLTTGLKMWLSGGITGIFESELFMTYGKEMFLSFCRALFQKQQTGILLHIGFSVVFCFFAFAIGILIFRKLHLLQSFESRWLLTFIVVEGILEYAILLFSVETMFLGEYGNYGFENRDNMVLLIKRYGCPYVVGTTMLLLQILFQRLEPAVSERIQSSTSIKRAICSVWLCVITVSIAVSPVDTLWYRYVTYRNDQLQLARNISERLADQPEIMRLVETIAAARKFGNQKILLLTDGSIPLGSELNYYAAPTAVIMDNAAGDRVTVWSDLLSYYHCTAICFVTDGADEEWLKGIETEEGENVVPYQIYTPTEQSSAILKPFPF